MEAQTMLRDRAAAESYVKQRVVDALDLTQEIVRTLPEGKECYIYDHRVSFDSHTCEWALRPRGCRAPRKGLSLAQVVGYVLMRNW